MLECRTKHLFNRFCHPSLPEVPLLQTNAQHVVSMAVAGTVLPLAPRQSGPRQPGVLIANVGSRCLRSAVGIAVLGQTHIPRIGPRLPLIKRTGAPGATRQPIVDLLGCKP